MSKDYKPFFSIITCTYNSERYLRECLTSVEVQTYKNYEHIIIDAFSNDKTDEIIDSYIRKNPRVLIKVYKLKAKGIPNAFNFGISKAKGKYINFLNSDDYYYSKETLKYVYAESLKFDEPLWIQGVSHYKTKFLGVKFGNFFFGKGLDKIAMSVFPIINHQGSFLQRKVFREYGKYDEKYSIADYKYWIENAWRIKIAYSNKIFTSFRMHGKNAGTGIRNLPKSFFELIKIWIVTKNIPILSGFIRSVLALKYRKF